ncbi:MAG: hypothetical protein FJ010_10150 [Chloroflexi bacterium]|nr:hypothetical protein [Chloroflexota bacterium]
MTKIIPFILILLLTSCSAISSPAKPPADTLPPPTILATPASPVITASAVPSETPTITPTATEVPPTETPFPSETPTQAVNYTDIVLRPPNEWPADIRTQFNAVLTDPWHADKTEFDAFLTRAWHEALKADGVANADRLTGYDLLNAIVEYAHRRPIVEGETEEQMLSHIPLLPFSLHELIRTDMNNLVLFHHEPGRYVEGRVDYLYKRVPSEEFQGPLQKFPYDWGYYSAWYGYGFNGGLGTHEQMLMISDQISDHQEFYGKPIVGIRVIPGVAGDLTMLFRLPGIDPRIAVGGLVRMYEGNAVRYAELFIPFEGNKTTAEDACLDLTVGRVVTAILCGEGRPIGYTEMRDSMLLANQAPLRQITLAHLVYLMRIYPDPHLAFYPDVEGMKNVWKDGIPVVSSISAHNLPEDFWK